MGGGEGSAFGSLAAGDVSAVRLAGDLGFIGGETWGLTGLGVGAFATGASCCDTAVAGAPGLTGGSASDERLRISKICCFLGRSFLMGLGGEAGFRGPAFALGGGAGRLGFTAEGGLETAFARIFFWRAALDT